MTGFLALTCLGPGPDWPVRATGPGLAGLGQFLAQAGLVLVVTSGQDPSHDSGHGHWSCLAGSRSDSTLILAIDPVVALDYPFWPGLALTDFGWTCLWLGSRALALDGPGLLGLRLMVLVSFRWV